MNLYHFPYEKLQKGNFILLQPLWSTSAVFPDKFLIDDTIILDLPLVSGSLQPYTIL